MSETKIWFFRFLVFISLFAVGLVFIEFIRTFAVKFFFEGYSHPCIEPPCPVFYDIPPVFNLIYVIFLLIALFISMKVIKSGKKK